MIASDGTSWERGDVEEQLGRQLTDEEWEKVQETRWWQKGIVEAMTTTGWECIDAMLDEMEIINEDNG